MSGPVCGRCGSAGGLRLFAVGRRCPACTPAAVDGRPEPGQGRYCPPRICWDGLCPHADAVVPPTPTTTVIDTRHVLSGKRRSTPAGYASARAQHEHTERTHRT